MLSFSYFQMFDFLQSFLDNTVSLLKCTIKKSQIDQKTQLTSLKEPFNDQFTSCCIIYSRKISIFVSSWSKVHTFYCVKRRHVTQVKVTSFLFEVFPSFFFSAFSNSIVLGLYLKSLPFYSVFRYSLQLGLFVIGILLRWKATFSLVFFFLFCYFFAYLVFVPNN